MQIIPVIDIKSGQVVVAQQGLRKSYQPLSTSLCHSSQIDDVVNAYLDLYTFSHVYIADLDALMQIGDNHGLINKLFSRYPDLNFMIDNGSAEPVYTPLKTEQLIPVIATEAVSAQELSILRQQTENFILSLDFSAEDTQMGEERIYQCSSLWPEQVILMTLGLVGKNSGPDLAKLAYYHQNYPQHHFIAAGGIRHVEDLLQLKKMGIETALVASALHNGNLSSDDIRLLEAMATGNK